MTLRIPANSAYIPLSGFNQPDPRASGSNLHPTQQRHIATMPHDGVWALRQAPLDQPNPHAFIGPPLVQPTPIATQAPNRLKLDEVVKLFTMIKGDLSAAAEVRNADGNTGMPNPQGRRSLCYRGTTRNNDVIHITLNIDASNSLQWMQLHRRSANGQLKLSRETVFSSPAPGSPVALRERRPEWFTNFPIPSRQIGSVRPRSGSASPPEATLRQRLRPGTSPRAAPGATVDPQPMPLLRDMETMHLFQPSGSRFIDPSRFNRPLSVPAEVHDDALTVDAMRYDEEGNLRSYLERQHRYSCGQHGLNAMIGGPLVSMDEFAHYEHRHPRPGAQPGEPEVILDTMVNEGVNVETVLGVLHETGIPATAYTHMPMTNELGGPMMNWNQLAQIDALDTDRLLMHVSLVTQDAATGALYSLGSHFVAFRRGPDTEAWTLLDSQRNLPQTMAPLQYLEEQDAAAGLLNEVTVIVPHHQLRLAESNASSNAAGQTEASGGGNGPSGISDGGIANGTGGAEASRSALAMRREPQALETADARSSSDASEMGAEQSGASTNRFEYIGSAAVKESCHKAACFTIQYKDLDDGPDAKIRKKTYSLKKYDTPDAALQAMNDDIAKLRAGTFVPLRKTAQHEDIPGYQAYPHVTWLQPLTKSGKPYWRVKVNSRTRYVHLHQHDGSKIKAWAAAKRIADDIKAHPEKYQSRNPRAAAESILPRVSVWNVKNRPSRWRVEITGENNKKFSKAFNFENGNDVERDKSRRNAELFALSHGVRPVIRPAAAFAPGLSNVPIITWNSSLQAFQVHDGDEMFSYALSEHESDIKDARTAAEDHARAIAQARTFQGG